MAREKWRWKNFSDNYRDTYLRAFARDLWLLETNATRETHFAERKMEKCIYYCGVAKLSPKKWMRRESDEKFLYLLASTNVRTCRNCRIRTVEEFFNLVGGRERVFEKKQKKTSRKMWVIWNVAFGRRHVSVHVLARIDTRKCQYEAHDNTSAAKHTVLKYRRGDSFVLSFLFVYLG